MPNELLITCSRCGARCSIRPPFTSQRYTCWRCQSVVFVRPEEPQSAGALPLGTALGGVAIGAAIGGPPGAVVGGLLGLLFGAAASK